MMKKLGRILKPFASQEHACTKSGWGGLSHFQKLYDPGSTLTPFLCHGEENIFKRTWLVSILTFGNSWRQGWKRLRVPSPTRKPSLLPPLSRPGRGLYTETLTHVTLHTIKRHFSYSAPGAIIPAGRPIVIIGPLFSSFDQLHAVIGKVTK